MNISSTTDAAYPLGRWLLAMAISLVLLAMACAQAPDLPGQLGLHSPSAQPAPAQQRGYYLTPGQAPVFASAFLHQSAGAAPLPPLHQ
jgi:hypothetical protein